MIEGPFRLRIDRVVFLEMSIDRPDAEVAVSSLADALEHWGAQSIDVNRNVEWNTRKGPSELGKALASHVMTRVLSEVQR